MGAIESPSSVSDRRHGVLYVAVLVLLTLCRALPAAITTTGNVTPDPATTNIDSTLIVGEVADGGLFINGGSHVLSSGTYMAYNAGISAAATVEGNTSKWSPYSLYVGHGGSGVLSISNGGSLDAVRVRIGL